MKLLLIFRFSIIFRLLIVKIYYSYFERKNDKVFTFNVALFPSEISVSLQLAPPFNNNYYFGIIFYTASFTWSPILSLIKSRDITRHSRKSYSVPQNFSWFKNYKLNGRYYGKLFFEILI